MMTGEWGWEGIICGWKEANFLGSEESVTFQVIEQTMISLNPPTPSQQKKRLVTGLGYLV